MVAVRRQKEISVGSSARVFLPKGGPGLGLRSVPLVFSLFLGSGFGFGLVVSIVGVDVLRFYSFSVLFCGVSVGILSFSRVGSRVTFYRCARDLFNICIFFLN